jgi:hypothetical protein
MALNTTNSLFAQITAVDDTTQNVPINFGTGNPAFDSNEAQFTRYLKLNGGANPIGLPVTPATEVYIKNTDAAKTIQVIWTQNGGAPANICVLNPGAQIILWDNPTGATTPGITALTLTPSAAGCFCEIFFGG